MFFCPTLHTKSCGVLGEGYHGSPLSQSWHVNFGNFSFFPGKSGETPPKNRQGPRPTKTKLTLERLQSGLRVSLELAELEDLRISKLSIEDLRTDDDSHRLSDRWWGGDVKGLESRLSLVDDLSQLYSKGERVREGVRGMAYAYSVSSGSAKENALANVKAGFRECTDALCTLEDKLQCLLGTFHMEIKGIQGFSRLCGGDVFEISLRHGIQKWKTRGRVGKDGSQTWEVPRALFRGVLGELIHIKASEVKMLGKQLLLGNKFCEITELFSAEPQLMTVNLNPTGSLKLNLLIVWEPLGSIKRSSGSLSSSPGSSLPRERRLSRHADSPQEPVTSTFSPSQSEEGDGAYLQEDDRDRLLWERSFLALELPHTKSSRLRPNKLSTPEIEESRNFYLQERGENFEVEEQLPEKNSLRDVVLRLSSLLEDVQGQFSELETLHRHTNSILALLHKVTTESSFASLNVQSALDSFNFLDASEEVTQALRAASPHEPPFHGRVGGTTESGISFGEYRTPSPPEGTFLGSQWEKIISVHVQTALRLMHKVSSYSPLRSGEKCALRKLQNVGHMFGLILSQLDREESPEEREDDGVRHRLIGEAELLPADEAKEILEKEVRRVLGACLTTQEIQRIAQRLLCQILDTEEATSQDKLTMFHVAVFFRHQTFSEAVHQIAHEEAIVTSFSDATCFETRLQSLSTTSLPPKSLCLLLIGHLIKDDETRSIVIDFFNQLSSVSSRKREVVEICTELLESSESLERRMGCVSLGFIGGISFAEALAYYAETDEDEDVRSAAKESLRRLGEVEISQDIALSTHGFQGLGLQSTYEK